MLAMGVLPLATAYHLHERGGVDHLAAALREAPLGDETAAGLAAVLLGHVGDRHGRRTALLWLAAMGLIGDMAEEAGFAELDL